MPLTTPITFTSSDQRQSLTWCSQIWPSDPDPMPALLHTTCTAPNASSVASRNASTDSSDVTSVTTPIDVATLVAQLAGRLVDQRRHDVGEHDLHALVGEPLDERAPDAPGRPR